MTHREVTDRTVRSQLLLLAFTLALGTNLCRAATAGGCFSVWQDDTPTQTEEKTHPANHLADETSPYLLMHARNPVDWYPWGSEALSKAVKENKPIFLSVGYSSCHWCHVMERESFLDEEIAALLNEHFVCIKVDREERPDIDNIYMRSLYVYHALIGSRQGGGWPLSVFLTPQGEPFFAGTYYPARDGDRGNATGFLTLVTRVHEAWSEKEEAIRKDAGTIANATRRELEEIAIAEDFVIDATLLARTMASFGDEFDKEHGGFGFSPTNDQIPKFPEASNLEFLLSIATHREKDDSDESRKTDESTTESRKAAQQMLLTTLDAMARGGIRDHLGGGFHRYSVDRFWHIPHFEKMLYDQGQLASLYAEAYDFTKDDTYRKVLEELLEFVSREMTSPEGAFYAALDAESEGEEGKFYRWDRETIQEALDDSTYRLFAKVYGLDQDPNFEGHYALQLSRPLEALAEELSISPNELDQRLQPAREKLLAIRSERPRPLTDTKILSGWNGLMIRGFADAGRVLGEEEYTKQAEQAAQFIWDRMRDDDGRLMRTYGNGTAKLNGYLTDYAYVIDAYLALHETTDNPLWLERAEQLSKLQEELFWDERQGGFFFTSDDHESLLARAKNPADQAEPAGNSVAATNMMALAAHFPDRNYPAKVRQTIESVSGVLQRAPHICPRLLIAAQAWMETSDDSDEE